MIHLKLFHHYIKQYFKYFKAATEALPEYQRLLEDEAQEDDEEEEEDKVDAPVPASAIISLLSSSSDEVSPDEDNNGAESEATWESEDQYQLGLGFRL